MQQQSMKIFKNYIDTRLVRRNYSLILISSAATKRCH